MPARHRNRNRDRIALGITVATGLAIATVQPARADGAFPNSQSVMLPRDRPTEIVLGTTFGLVFTEDDGATWRYSCENDMTRMGRQYVMGPPPDDRIYALSDLGVPVTDNGACTWTVGGGDLTLTAPIDVFPDPADPSRAFVLALGLDDGLVSAYRSTDAGKTFLGPIITSPAGARITGIEIAASAPRTTYMTLFQQVVLHPLLALSEDGGDSWTITDIEPGLGVAIPYLMAVDPTDSRKLYLRITNRDGDPQQFQGLAVTTDAGMTWAIPLKLMEGSLVGFARSPDGTLFAAGTTAPLAPGDAPVPAAFRSDDGGQTFTTQPLPFHPAGLAQRDGTLFAATSDVLDGFALASSDDGGQSWRPRLKFADIAGVKDCVRSTCQADCDDLAGIKLFPPETCNPPPDAGAPDAVRESPRSASGCGCGAGTAGDASRGSMLGAAMLLLCWFVARARRR